MHPKPKHYKGGKGAMGLKAKGKRAVAVWFSAEEYARLVEVAAENGQTVAYVVRNVTLFACRQQVGGAITSTAKREVKT